MRLVRTIHLRLKEDPHVFQPTIDAYTKAFNYTCEVGWKDKNFNGVELHKKVYKTTREYLPSQLACSFRMKASEALKATSKRLKKGKKVSCPQSMQTSIRYDDRSYNIWFERNEISLLTLDGRKKFKINVPEYFKQYLSWKRCSADLFIRREKVFLNIVFEKNIDEPVYNGNIIGIDRGMKRIAVTSDKRFFGGGRVRRISKRYKRLRQSLQSKGHSGKRHFRKISCKENRFRKDVNHCISKRIVETLKPGDSIVLEKLKNINKSVNKFKGTDVNAKEKRRERMSWSFFQLEQFITYKAESKGVKVDYVSACYTSRGCSKCGHIARENRACQSNFRCVKCGYQLNADLNASFNIVLNYKSHLDATCYPDRAAFNQPLNAPVRQSLLKDCRVEQATGFNSCSS